MDHPIVTQIEKYGYPLDYLNDNTEIYYCDGCGQAINQNEDFYEDESGVTKIHDDPYCAKEYIAKRAIKHIGKEK